MRGTARDGRRSAAPRFRMARWRVGGSSRAVAADGLTQPTHRRPSIADVVGRTPLLRLRALSDATGCEILGKAEFLNPGGSVKDRTALGLIAAAEASGALRPGGTIVEASAGNTGIGLTLHGIARGYRSIVVIPDTISAEKIAYLRALGADVRTVRPAPYGSPGNFQHVARRLAETLPGSWWANQFDNTANRAAHYHTTGPEIWEQTAGRVTTFVAAVGSGGTVAGTGAFLKERDSRIRVVAVDPYGGGVYAWVKHGHMACGEGESIAEGIGQTRITGNLAGAAIDDALRIADAPAVAMLHHLRRTEGIFTGLSAAMNVCAAEQLAREGGPGQVIVTILCDTGARYVSTLFDPAWLAARGFVVAG